jgi:hypothetical protein
MALKLIDQLASNSNRDDDDDSATTLALCRLTSEDYASVFQLIVPVLRHLCHTSKPARVAVANAQASPDILSSLLLTSANPSLTLQLIEVLCFENTAFATVLAARGIAVQIWSLFTTNGVIVQGDALRALTNMTNECPRAVSELVDHAKNVIPTAVSALVDKCDSLLTGGSNNNNQQAHDAASDFDTCLMLLCLLANMCEQKPGLCDFALNHLDQADRLADLYAKTLPARALIVLQSGDTNSTVEFGWTPEELVLSAHVCLLLGCLTLDDACKQRVSARLPGKRGFTPLVQTLQAFLEFQHQAGVLTPEADRAIRRVAGYLQGATHALMLPPPLAVVRKQGKGKKKC